MSEATTMNPMFSAAVGDYPHTSPLKDGRVTSAFVKLDFADIMPITRAFAPMIREARFDVCEMAIASFLQARAHRKPIALLPIVLAARFQEASLLCRADSSISGPNDLIGRRVGVRAYSQTTGMWLRGVLMDDYGIAVADIQWTTFEGAHVAEYADPPYVKRAAPGEDMLAMLREGDLDAVIVGSDVPADPAFRTVFREPNVAGTTFFQKHGFVPINHLLTVRSELVQRYPFAVRALVQMFRDAGACRTPHTIAHPNSRDEVDDALQLASRYAFEQELIPQSLSLSQIWDGTPAELT